MIKSYSIPVSLLRQYCFCPRIVFFQEIHGLHPESPLWVKQGVENHLRATMLEKRRNLARLGIDKGERRFNVHFHSAKLGIHGIADGVVIGDDWVTVLEFKPETSIIRSAHWVQAVAYGLLAEEFFGRSLRSVALLYGERGKTAVCAQDIDTEKQRVLRIIDAIYALLQAPTLPASDASPDKCAQCEYLNFCNDRELRNLYL